uniref:Metallothionein n=1 Tax=Taiwanofungus camphoratus TaxID=2696576 RepID=D2CFL2_TAICA|nr:metallothionein [Taiwanofungus camphoratus]
MFSATTVPVNNACGSGDCKCTSTCACKPGDCKCTSTCACKPGDCKC